MPRNQRRRSPFTSEPSYRLALTLLLQPPSPRSMFTRLGSRSRITTVPFRWRTIRSNTRQDSMSPMPFRDQAPEARRPFSPAMQKARQTILKDGPPRPGPIPDRHHSIRLLGSRTSGNIPRFRPRARPTDLQLGRQLTPRSRLLLRSRPTQSHILPHPLGRLRPASG